MKRIVTFVFVATSSFLFYLGGTYEKQDITTQTIVVGVNETIIDESSTVSGTKTASPWWYESLSGARSLEVDSTFYNQLPSGYDITTLNVTSVRFRWQHQYGNQGFYMDSNSSDPWDIWVSMPDTQYYSPMGFLTHSEGTAVANFVENMLKTKDGNVDLYMKTNNVSDAIYFEISYTVDYESNVSYVYIVDSINLPNTYVMNETMDIVINLTNTSSLVAQFVTINGVTYDDSQFTQTQNQIVVPVTVTDESDLYTVTVDSVQTLDTVVTLGYSGSMINEGPKEVASGGSVYFLDNSYDLDVVEYNQLYNMEIEINTPNTNFFPAEVGIDGNIYQFNPADFPVTDTEYTIKIPFTNVLQYGTLTHHLEYVILQDSTSTDRVKFEVFDNGGLGWNFTLDVNVTFADTIDPLGVTIVEQVNTVKVTEKVPIKITIPNYDTLATDYEISKVYINGIPYPVTPEDVVNNEFTIQAFVSSNPSDIGTQKVMVVQQIVFKKNFGTVEVPDWSEDYMALNYQFTVDVISPIDLSGLSLSNAFFDKAINLSHEDLTLNVFVNNPNEYVIDYLQRTDDLMYTSFTQTNQNGITTVTIKIPTTNIDQAINILIDTIGVRMSFNGVGVEDSFTVPLDVSTQVLNYYYDTNLQLDQEYGLQTPRSYYFTGETVPVYFKLINPDDVDVYKFVINGELYIPTQITNNEYLVNIKPYSEWGSKHINLEKIISTKESIEKEKYVGGELELEVYDSEFALDTSVLTFNQDGSETIYEGDTVPLKIAYTSTINDLVFRSITINGTEYKNDEIVHDPLTKTITLNTQAPTAKEQYMYQITEMSFVWNGRIGVRSDYNKNYTMIINSNYDRIQDDILEGQDSWLFDKAIPYWDNASVLTRTMTVLGITSPATIPVGVITYNRVLKAKLLERAERLEQQGRNVGRLRFPKINLPKVKIPKIRLPKIKINRKKKK